MIHTGGRPWTEAREDFLTPLRRAIRAELARAGTTQKAFGLSLGLSPNYASRVLRGSMPGLPALGKMVEALGLVITVSKADDSSEAGGCDR